MSSHSIDTEEDKSYILRNEATPFASPPSGKI